MEEQRAQQEQQMRDDTAVQRQAEKDQVTAESKSRLADAEAFDSVRQAALTMFKQRTKDLTRLAHVEAQSQSIQTELQEAQAQVAELSAQQASLEAIVEDEQQRLRQREGCLSDLHGALVQVDEEQRLCTRLYQNAESVIHDATAFIQNFTDAEGRLFQLLAKAKARVSGRSARELQTVLAQTQQMTAGAAEQHQRLCHGGVTSPPDKAAGCGEHDVPVTDGTDKQETELTVVHTLSEVVAQWASQANSWSRHEELQEVGRLLHQISQIVGTVRNMHENDDAEKENEETDSSETTEVADLSCTVQRLRDNVDVVDEMFFNREQIAKSVALGQTTDAVEAPVVPAESSASVSGRCVTPAVVTTETFATTVVMTSLSEVPPAFKQLQCTCAARDFSIPAELHEAVDGLQQMTEEWVSLLKEKQRYEALAKEAERSAYTMACAEHQLSETRTALQRLCALCDAAADACVTQRAQLQDGKEVELHNYTEAWQKGYKTLAAQQASLDAVRRTTEARQREAAQTRAVQTAEAAQHATAIAAQHALLDELQCSHAEALKELESGQTFNAAVKAETATLEHNWHVATKRVEELLAMGQSTRDVFEPWRPGVAVDGVARDDGQHRALDATAEALQEPPGMCKALPQTSEELNAFLNAADDLSKDSIKMTHLVMLLENWKGEAAEWARLATVLELPVDIFEPSALGDDKAIREAFQAAVCASLRDHRTACAAFLTFVKEVEDEGKLLRRELAETE